MMECCTVTTTRANLLDALSIAARITPKKSPSEELMRVTLSCRDHEIRTFACDLMASADTHMAGECDGDFEVCVSGRDLFDIARRCSEGPVTIEVESTKITVRSGKAHWSLPATDADHAPLPIELGSETPDGVVLDGSQLAAALAQVKPMSGDDTRPHLWGVYVELEAGLLRAVACNAHVIAVVDCRCDVTASARTLIPLPTAELLSRVLTPGKATLRIGARAAVLDMGATTLGMRLADDQFPPYRKVIPKKSSSLVSVDRDALAAEIKRVALDGEMVVLRFGPAGLHIDWSNKDGRRSAGEVECDYDGKGLTIGAAAHYLTDALAASTEGALTIGVSGEADPLVLRTSGPERETTVVLMPMRIP